MRGKLRGIYIPRKRDKLVITSNGLYYFYRVVYCCFFISLFSVPIIAEFSARLLQIRA
jgi:hypothetical protein